MEQPAAALAESEPEISYEAPLAMRQPRPRDWTTSILTVVVIGVALLLGWMLGHAGWQHMVGTVKEAPATSSNGNPPSSRAATGAAGSDAVDSNAVFPAAPKSTPPSAHPARSPFQSPSQSRGDAGSQPDGGLVVYEGGKIIFQQSAPRSRSNHSGKGGTPESRGSESNGAPGDAVSLSPEVASSYLIRRVEPVYPEDARLRSIEGEVRLEALVGTDGSVQVLRLISGDSQLAQAAADAVRQWRFRPYKSNGKTEEFSTRLTVSFRLQ
jgi:protein TonB